MSSSFNFFTRIYLRSVRIRQNLWLVLAVFLLAIIALQPAQAAVPWQTKVDPWVLKQAQKGEVEFLVFLSAQADLSAAASLPSKTAKGEYVYRQLTLTAQRTQPPILQKLQQSGMKVQPFWIANMILVRGDLTTVQMLARREDVSHLYSNPSVRLDTPEVESSLAFPASANGVEWNLLKVNADKVWQLGFRGAGVVIAGQDTGYEWTHPALKNAYRGWDGSSASHDYNWHDAIHAANLYCPADSPQPCDDNNHGTHTMGTMVGKDGTNQIGMAPEAKWIGCRNMNSNYGTPASYTECFQFFLAPTRLDGSDPRPDLAPDVINNSWSCPDSEGCTDPLVLETVVNNVRAAGILTVQSAGNSGPNCATINSPAAIYAASFTVGATDSTDTIVSFSSRGPVTVDGSNRPKPDISAPGSGIRSSIRGGTYGTLSGTSMAAPHVVGLAALLISANPGLRGNPDEIQAVIEQTALPRTTSQTCGSVPGTSIPNNTYGWGRIDALTALKTVRLFYYFPIFWVEAQ
jgi:subtilisin family serine protease